MGGVVVHDEMDVEVLRSEAVDFAQEAQKLGVTMTRVAFANDRALKHIERGEQGGGAVALVVVCHRACTALFHRQSGLGAVEGLDL